MIIKGKVLKFGDNVDTDQIMPAQYLTVFEPKKLAPHAMEGIDKNFAKRVKPGNIMVAGENFGCGSSREHAPLAIQAAGIAGVIARSFARIFYRNSVNIGLKVFECEETDKIKNGQEIEIDSRKKQIKILDNGKIFALKPSPEFIERLRKS
jgi:3-isopropylmalate/(R)-2-methylmalate dehydratase small subunit